MVELRSHPLAGGVAERAILRDPGAHVIRIIRRIEVGAVTTNAGCARQAEIVVHVTLRALHGLVRTGKREAGGRMVEAGARPVHGGMARRTILRETGGYMVGRGGLLEIRQVAAHAGRGNRGEVPVHVALRASHARVRPGQLKAAQAVIESGVLPARRVVASLAGRR